MDTLGFDWDADKELENIAKHAVSFAAAQAAFFDPRCVVLEDLAHGGGGPRYYCVGRVGNGILTVRFTMRGQSIRIIGAGFWRKGKAIHERENSLHR